MTTSNLTESERAVLEAVRFRRPYYGMVRDITRRLYLHKSWVSYILTRLVASGHIRRVARGVYEVTE